MNEKLLELCEEPGLWLPGEPKLSVFHGQNYVFIAYGRSAWVQRLRLEADEIDEVVDRIEAMLGLKGLDEGTWWLGELTTPVDLGERLLERGFEPDDPAEMTSFTIDEPPAGAASVEVRRAESFEEALQALEIDWEAFAVSEDERDLRRVEAEQAWPRIQADGRQTTYVAYDAGGEPVGFARAVFTMTAGLLLGGATLPGARGKGVYTSLVHARWEEAVERGIPRLAVSAGPQSAPILERLGFEPIGKVQLLRQRL
ncbi:MAG TPA: GNAT family N-acetyltransferase [Gaiellaceae bacterium]